MIITSVQRTCIVMATNFVLARVCLMTLALALFGQPRYSTTQHGFLAQDKSCRGKVGRGTGHHRAHINRNKVISYENVLQYSTMQEAECVKESQLIHTTSEQGPRNVNETATNSTTKDRPLPVLSRIDPVKVGHVRDVHIMPGKVHKMRTLSLRPLVFEIEDFLTADECDAIIRMAQAQGMEQSLTVSEAPTENEQGGNDVSDDAPRTRIVRPDNPVAAFKNVDTNEDGKLDMLEIHNGLRLLGSVSLTDDDFKEIVSELELDPNKDGIVTYEEFMEMAQGDKLTEIITYLEHLKEAKPNKRIRNSHTTFLDPYDHVGYDALFEDLNLRIQTVSGLPMGLIRSSETLQVLQYNPKQHYHCHYDTETEEEQPDTPCCHHVRYAEFDEQCRPCRFMTFFYYLHEPEEGGETAFPIADNETIAPQLINTVENYRCDLTTYCHKANLVYKPKKGATIFWYNHLVDQESGWQGPRDALSYHGGCDVIKGTKWAANNWLNAGEDREKDMAIWEEYAKYEALEAMEKLKELTKHGEQSEEQNIRGDIQQSDYNEEEYKQGKHEEEYIEQERVQQKHEEEYIQQERVQQKYEDEDRQQERVQQKHEQANRQQERVQEVEEKIQQK